MNLVLDVFMSTKAARRDGVQYSARLVGGAAVAATSRRHAEGDFQGHEHIAAITIAFLEDYSCVRMRAAAPHTSNRGPAATNQRMPDR